MSAQPIGLASNGNSFSICRRSHVSYRRQIEEHLNYRHCEEAERRLESVGLADRAHDAARVLSGGELQRVVIARALASGRPFVLADEPTGQLDHSTSAIVLEALLRSSGDAGVVIVTHDSEVAARCEVTFRIEDGRVLPA